MLFYSKKIKSNNTEQLTKDFGEFPPKPLKSNIKNKPFTIVYLSWFALRLHKLKLFFKTRKTDDENINSTQLIEFKKLLNEELTPKINKSKHNLKSIARKIKKENLPTKISALITIILLAPLLIIAALLFTIYLTASLVIIMNKSNYKNTLGFYVNEKVMEGEININTGLIKKLKSNTESVISHEHLHLLQSQSGDMGDITKRNDLLKSRSEILLDNTDDEALLYLLDRFECEARLHELIVDFYQENNILPVSYKEFIGALLSCDVLSNFFGKIFITKNSDIEYPVFKRFSIRQQDTLEEFQDMIEGIKDEFVVKERFSKEVLPTMYANLLRYYGDKAASDNMLESIPSTDMYDHLYIE